MAALTFLDTLKREVGKMQMAHPARANELARAHALIAMGMVEPSPTDQSTARVLSSDGDTRYTVNGRCDCQAGQHDKPCKHLAAWKLYRHILRKVEAQAPPVQDSSGNGDTQPLYEAPASVNLRVLLFGHETQITLRDSSEARLLDRLQVLLKRQDLRPIPSKPAPRSGGNWKQRSTQGR